MKRILTFSFLAAAAALAFSCGGPKANLTINGNISGYPGDKIYLSYTGQGDTNMRDSAKVVDGKFTFKVNVNGEGNASLYNKRSTRKYDPSIKYFSFYVEPGIEEFTAEWPADAPASRGMRRNEYKLTGSAVNDLDLELEKQLAGVTSDTTYKDIAMKFVMDHPDSYVSLDQMRFLSSQLNLEEFGNIIGLLGDNLKTRKVFEEINAEYEVLKQVQPGKPAPGFTRTTIDGKTVKLSDFAGKVVLLDFWASWCVPCRESMPHVKALYEKYHDKGLEVVCCADNDTQTDAWKAAIEKDGTSMFVHFLRGMKENPDGSFDRSDDLSDKYGVHYIPCKFLVGRDGNLIGVKMEDADLDSALKEAFGF